MATAIAWVASHPAEARDQAMKGRRYVEEHWRREKANVFIAKNQTYQSDLVRTIRDGLIACGFVAESLRDKRVLLKPNMVEPIRESPHMTTHPAVVLAAAEVFLINQIPIPHDKQPAMLAGLLNIVECLIELLNINARLLSNVGRIFQCPPAALCVGRWKVIVRGEGGTSQRGEESKEKP